MTTLKVSYNVTCEKEKCGQCAKLFMRRTWCGLFCVKITYDMRHKKCLDAETLAKLEGGTT